MRAVVQRVSSATVRVGDQTVGAIEQGLLVLVGVEQNDGPSDVQYITSKVRDMRVFDDATPARHLDRSVQDVNGAVLVVSQFTLYGDTRRGRRPGFSAAAAPEEANRLYRLLRGPRGRGRSRGPRGRLPRHDGREPGEPRAGDAAAGQREAGVSFACYVGRGRP